MTPGRQPQVLSPDAVTGAIEPGNGYEPGLVATHVADATPARPPARARLRLTLEGVCYLLLLTAAALTRFWDLGSRALHHDESLHAYYSWLFVTGEGYIHNPLMHGPFLFHANALVYLLFGDSDATSRYMPALFGTVLVGLPYFLRGSRFLGRYGALATSALFLISPSFLYYSRYIRHDLYTVVGSLLLFICLVRYIEQPRRGWLVGAAASLAFLFTNHEIVFAVCAVFVAYLWGALLWGRLRFLLPLQIATLALAGALVLTKPAIGPLDFGKPLPAIPWRGPTREQEIDYWQALLTHPLIVALIAIGMLFLLVAWGLIRDERRRQWDGLLDGAAPGSVERAVLAAGYDRVGLWAAAAAFLAIFATLFTTLFTNIEGLATGTVATDGTLLYWLGQQNVQRGSQPWFYFLYILPQYEFFVLLFGVAAVAVTLWRGGRRLLRLPTHDPAIFARFWLVVWFGAIFLGLSYAGEKMPWLIVHIALPGTLLAGALIGDLVERWVVTVQPSRRWAIAHLGEPAGEVAAPSGGWATAAWLGPGLAAALLAIGGGWWFLAADLSYGTFVREGVGWRRVVPAEALDRWWQLGLPPLAALLLVGLVWLARGRSYSGRWATVALIAVLALLQIHQAWRLSFIEGDVPRDSLIYNTTSPDVTRMVAELGQLSEQLTGGKGLVIWYDSGGNGVAWPLNWYFRDFPNAERIGGSLSAPPPEEAGIVIIAAGHRQQFAPYLAGYTPTDYVLRWHEPEYEIYRNFAIAPELEPSQSAWGNPANPHGLGAIIGSIGDSLATQLEPDGQARVWRIAMFRELPGTTMHFDFVVYVRNDLLPLLNAIRY